jgi:hypothetical protein
MKFWQTYKQAAGIALAFCLWVYFLIAVNQVFADHLTGYLQGLAFAVWNPLWIALVIAFCKSGIEGGGKEYTKEERTDEEEFWDAYDH